MRAIWGIAAVATAGLMPAPAAARSEIHIGDVIYVAYDFCPEGSTVADGSLFSIKDHQALYSLLGTTYGGDGIKTFAVPDLRKSPALDGANGTKLKACLVVEGDYPVRP